MNPMFSLGGVAASVILIALRAGAMGRRALDDDALRRRSASIA